MTKSEKIRDYVHSKQGQDHLLTDSAIADYMSQTHGVSIATSLIYQTVGTFRQRTSLRNNPIIERLCGELLTECGLKAAKNHLDYYFQTGK